MKKILAIAFFGVLLLSVGAAPRKGTLILSNGDKIVGALVGYDVKGNFLWRHPAVRTEMQVAGSGVSRLQLAAVTPIKGARPHSARVKLVNGDDFAGELAALDEKALTLDTWYAGRLRIPRAAIAHLMPGSTSKVVFEGPDSLKGWGAAVMGVYLGDDGDLFGGVTVERTVDNSPAQKAGLMAGDIITSINGQPFKERAKLIRFVKGHEPGDKVEVALKRDGKEKKFNFALDSIHWRMEEGALVSRGTGGIIGREFDWPGRVNVEFDLSWNATPSMDVILKADKLYTISYTNAYSIRINSSYVYLYRYLSAGPNNFQTASLGSAQVSRFLSGKKGGRFSIRMDEKKKTIALLIDNKHVKTWREPAAWAGKGRALQFSPTTPNPMVIGNIRVTEWDGRLPNQSIDAGGGDGKKDFVRLINDDSMSGEIGRIFGGKLTVKMPFAEKPLDVPLNRIGLVKFARVEGGGPGTLPEMTPIGRITEIADDRKHLGLEEFARGLAALGDELEIHREGKLVGQIKVIQNKEDAIVSAQIIAEADPVKKGDLVVRPGLTSPKEATASLTQRGKLSLRLHNWREGQTLVTHPYIGLIKLVPEAVNSIQFK
ncbi:MAG: hypothetical protein CMO74_12655 [Verrucomicrobiales bacterium]|nr:hypothetical protein [Verrucomicrobiales bacterium]|tara:strand:- start:11156 stop:12955 length:1800 start_codon:yes stop_codon:yes gene_type:complete